jgi:ribonuclease HII
MPWQIGIDEAGYGPNLGPLVMTAVACHVPKAGSDPWKLLTKAVRRQGEREDGRLLVADSKEIYSPARGLGPLETSVLSMLVGGGVTAALASELAGGLLAPLLQCLGPSCLEELQEEHWYRGDTRLPVAAEWEQVAAGAEAVRQCCEHAGIEWGLVASAVVPAPRFNGLVEKWGSKGSVLGLALVDLVQRCLELPGFDSLALVVDKHGGRNHYSAVLQHAFADGLVLGCEEGANRSEYVVIGLDRPVRVTFMPRADGENFCVALASMVSKYLRELLMGEFNRFWQREVPGLEATAGYPGDSARFFEEIAPALAKLGIERRRIWRER